MNFTETLLRELKINVGNNYKDNYDYLRFGVQSQQQHEQKINTEYFKSTLLKIKNKIFSKRRVNELKEVGLQQSLFFEYLYNRLHDNQSKKLLIKIVAFRLLGHEKVKLPLNTPEYWGKLKEVEQMADKNEFINPNFLDFILYKFDVKSLGYPITLYFTILGIFNDYVIRQYEYKHNNISISAEEGDIVIDAGGCWGDTALFFANSVGEKGRVYSFEFVPNNLKIFKENLSLNPQLLSRISIITNPLWCESGRELYFQDFGPGSSVSFEPRPAYINKVTTISIDEWVTQQGVDKVDYIKMDIEGAELSALKGAVDTLTRFRPKLAIALYHQPSDFDSIPRYIDSLDLDYSYFLGHYSIHAEETVLFAIPKI